LDPLARDVDTIRNKVAGLSLVTQNAVRDEMRHRFVYVQFGELSGETRIGAGDVTDFEWLLEKPVNPVMVLEARAKTIVPLPGVMMSAEVTEDGKSCKLHIYGKILRDFASKPIQAQVEITVRDDKPDPTH
jgi:hypothetical protein